MAPGAVSANDVDHTAVKLNGKSNGVKSAPVEDIKLDAHEKTDLVLRTFRCLIADLCHQFGCGHPGYDHFSPAGGKSKTDSLTDPPWEWPQSV